MDEWVFGYNAFGMEMDRMYFWVKCLFWMGININMCFNENHFKRFHYTQFWKKKIIPLTLKIYIKIIFFGICICFVYEGLGFIFYFLNQIQQKNQLYFCFSFKTGQMVLFPDLCLNGWNDIWNGDIVRVISSSILHSSPFLSLSISTVYLLIGFNHFK